MYKQEPTLTINVKYNLADNEGNESEYLSEKVLMPCLQMQSQWEQTCIKQLVKSFV